MIEAQMEQKIFRNNGNMRPVFLSERQMTNNNPTPISRGLRILLFASTDIINEALAQSFASPGTIQLIHQAKSVAESKRYLDKCDIVILQLPLPFETIFDLSQYVRQSHPHKKVIVANLSRLENSILEYIEAGIEGYIYSDDPKDVVLEKIQATCSGRPIIPPEITAALIDRLADLASQKRGKGLQNRLESLTIRELEILHLMAQNLTNRQISERLFIELGTVKNHVHNLLTKLRVRNRRAAVSYLQMVNDTHDRPNSTGKI